MLRNEDTTRTMTITVETMAIITVITVAETMVVAAETDDVDKEMSSKKPFSVILKGFLRIFYFQSKSYLTLRYSFNSMDELP